MGAKIKQNICPNCQTALETEENFCPTCGQENREIMLPAFHLLSELFDSMFNLDSRFFKTLLTIFTHPGKITKEYNVGKRRRYAPPLRIYLISSLLFFLLMGINNRKDLVTVDNQIGKSIEAGSEDTLDLNLGTETIHLTWNEVLGYRDFDDVQLDSALLSKEIEPTWFNKLSTRQGLKILDGGVGGFVEQLSQSFSIGMFFLMPILGWLLLLFFRRLKKPYVYHLIFSIHLHSIAFLVYSIAIVGEMLFSFTFLEDIFNLGILIYFILSLKNVYDLKWGESILKFFLLLITYFIVLLIAMVIISIISLMIF